ncbi:hypothetical protein TthSNM17_24090 (plasmid) [Thermus thermophilus]|nr:hypothetical protein TthSNM17_24090 [Thermus thermophilus]
MNPMELFLVRHALALPPEGEGEEADDRRPSPPRGCAASARWCGA